MRQLEIISKNHIIMMIEKRQRILRYLNKQKKYDMFSSEEMIII